LPPRPNGPDDREWQSIVVTVAAYRDRYRVTGDSLLGDAPTTFIQRDEVRRIRALVQDAASGNTASDLRSLQGSTAAPDVGL
jgi:hypothetical protein